MSKRNYKVGYGKPPVNSQFKPGVSGYPAGLPRKRRNLFTLFEEKLYQRVTVNGPKGSMRISKLELLVTNLINQGVKGDARARTLIFDHLLPHLGHQEAQKAAEIAPLSQHEEEIVADFLKRLNPSKEEV